MMNIIITMPTFNEEVDIKASIDDIRRVMAAESFGSYRILVQDDASTDSTVLIARQSADHVFCNSQHSGLAETYRNEIKHALALGADIIVHTDADRQYPEKFIPEMIRQVQGGNDLVIGSRFLGGMRYGNSSFLGVGNVLFSKICSLISGTPITDITSGFRAMNKRTASLIQIRSEFTYTYEQYLQATFRKLKIIEVPIEGMKTRKSHLVRNPFYYAFRAFQDFLAHYDKWKQAS